MSDSTDSSRQATHAKQEGVDDNVAALSGPVVVEDQGSTEDQAAPVERARWTSSVNAAPADASLGGKQGSEFSGRWVAAAGIGSAALVAALLYANRGTKSERKPPAKHAPAKPSRDED